MVDIIKSSQLNNVNPSFSSDKKINKMNENGIDFKETLKEYINDVNQMQLDADKAVQQLVSGEIDDVSKVVSAVEEANIAFQMMMQIRNKLTEAYQEIMRMQV